MKQDRRVQKTIQLYQNALLELLKKKGLKEISIKELSECALLHRGSFYAHYKGLTELLYSIERDVIQKLEAICHNEMVDHFHDLPYSVLNDIFCFLDQYKEIMIIFFTKDDYFVCEMKRIVMIYCIHSCQHMYHNASKEEYDFLCLYMVDGMMAVFKEWLYDTSKGRLSAEEMAWKLQRVMLLGIHSLQK